MPTADEFLRTAAVEIDYRECDGHPHTNRNHTKFAAHAGHANGYPWCATFIVAIARRLDLELPSTSAYTPTMANGFKAARRWHTTPQRGDVAFFDFPDSTRRIQHVGIVESSTPTTVTCIEGNTSPGTGGSQDNGGGVYRRTRPRAHVVGYGRPAFTTSPPALPVVDAPATRHYAEGIAMARIDTTITLDADGNGWALLSLPFHRLLSVTTCSERRPPVNGTYDTPDNDRDEIDEDPVVRPAEHDGKVMLVAKGGAVGHAVRCIVTASDV